MAQWLRQNTAVKFMVGPAVATGGLAAVTTLKASTVTALRIRKHSATVVVTVTGRGLTHVSGGHYFVPLTSVDTNTLGHFRLYVRASGTAKALPMWQDGQVVPTNVFDSLVSGSAKLNVGTLASAAVVWTAAGRTLSSGSAIWSALRANNGASGTFGRALGVGTIVRENTLQSGTAQTAMLDAGASAQTTLYRELTIILTSGTGAGQARMIDAYNGVTKVVTVTDPWTITPNSTTKFMLLARGPAAIGYVDTDGTTWAANAIWDSARSSHVAGGSFGLGVQIATGARGQADLVSRVWTNTATELGAVPAASPTTKQGMMFLYMSARNKRLTTATGDKIHNSATSVIATAPISTTSVSFSKGKYA